VSFPDCKPILKPNVNTFRVTFYAKTTFLLFSSKKTQHLSECEIQI